MGRRYGMTYQVPFYDSDQQGRIKLSNFLSLALHVSGLQSLELGLADADLLAQRNLVWVITNYQLNIQSLPRFGQTIRIETEAVSYNKFFCYRIFEIKDDQTGQELMTIQASFVMIDATSRKVQEVPDDLVAPYEAEKIRKIKRGPKYPDLLDWTSQIFAIRYFDLDMNGHINNSKYLEWVLDSLGIDFLSQHRPTKIDLTFVKEIRALSGVEVRVQRDGLTSQHEIWQGDQLHAQAQIEWRRDEL